MDFVAIDFETSNYDSNSACAIGLVVVRNNVVVSKHPFLFCPPDSNFTFTEVHGISFNDVKNKPAFDKMWPQLQGIIGRLPLVAHNAKFDARVLRETLNYYGVSCPKIPCVCTCLLSRRVWPQLTSHSLDVVANHLNLPLDHHNPISDAEVCAQIAIQASLKSGFSSLLTMANGLGIRYDYLMKDIATQKEKKSPRTEYQNTVRSTSWSAKTEDNQTIHTEEIKAIGYTEDIAATNRIADELSVKLCDLRVKYGLYKKKDLNEIKGYFQSLPGIQRDKDNIGCLAVLFLPLLSIFC